MFAVYAARSDPENPLASLVVGERPEPEVPDGWVKVKISHASLNRHDLFTLRGITAHPDPIPFPMILGNDGAGTLEDGTPVVIYPVMGSDDWFILLPVLSDQITVCGSIMARLHDMKCMIRFVVSAGIRPEIGQVLPMEYAKEAFRAMWEGRTQGKTVFTR
jgi:NADPH:quinone reductase-like Zn-dependent oxidoreductase